MNLLAREIVETAKPVSASIIWLHGLGASGHDFVPIVPMLGLPETLGVRFIFPHAPAIPVTINGGMIMPAWYDIYSMDMGRKIDNRQIRDSADKVNHLIDNEINQGINSDRIILVGFSQGGAVCYEAGLSFEKPLGGLLALSTYFATPKSIKLSKQNASLPIHIFHGTEDNIVDKQMGVEAQSTLQRLGYQPEYKEYSMGHEVNLQEIHDIGAWIKHKLG